jgi:predicted P-loop ATPase
MDLDDVRDRFRSHKGNIGVFLALGGLVLIDADGELGLETAKTWTLPETLTARTGSGHGAHYIYRFAPNQDPGAVTDRRVAPGLDVKVRGQFVAAPSKHASGGVYRWTVVVPPLVLPVWLYERIRKNPSVPLDPPSATHETPGGLEKRARAYMAAIPPAIAGAGGHAQAFAAARALTGWLHKGLSESVALSLLSEYNATCAPPWSAQELAHKWRDAKASNVKPALEDRPRLRSIPGGRAQPPPVDTGEPPPPAESNWRQELMYKTNTKTGQEWLISHVDNVIRILQLDPRWSNKLSYDSFAQRVVCDDLPWDQYQKPTEALTYWTDEDGTRLCAWLRRDWQRSNFDPSVIECERAVDVVSRGHAFHPVRVYLDSITWDGTSRLNAWLSTYLGAEPSEYHSVAGRWWLISAVARILDPGCKVDTVPVLEGPQGKRKSTAIAVLADKWFSDAEIDLNSKDAAQLIQGCWLVELAELDSLMRVEPSEAKRFFSRPVDRVRLPWGRRPVDLPRQCVFVGTTNLREYLNDPTGARRILPIACGDIDIEALRRDRDQLWAEAVHEYEDGRVWYPENSGDRALVGEHQEARTNVDSWEDKLSAYLNRNGLLQTTTMQLLEGALAIPTKDWTRPAMTRVGILMSKLGWSKRRIRIEGRLTWTYERSNVVPTSIPENA